MSNRLTDTRPAPSAATISPFPFLSLPPDRLTPDRPQYTVRNHPGYRTRKAISKTGIFALKASLIHLDECLRKQIYMRKVAYKIDSNQLIIRNWLGMTYNDSRMIQRALSPK
jgi:hypothetical protein